MLKKPIGFGIAIVVLGGSLACGQTQIIKPSCSSHSLSKLQHHHCPACAAVANVGDQESGFGETLALFPAFVDGVFTMGDTSGDSPYDLDKTFMLESRPGSTKTIYLDFDGHHSFNNFWDHDIVFDPFDRDGDPGQFSDSELIEIQRQFQNTAEDFLPFDVNVTTKDPGLEGILRSSVEDQVFGIRVVNTQGIPGGFGSGIGGVAFVNVFSFVPPPEFNDSPAFTFNKGENNGALTNSHEVGHTLGLFHHGLNGLTYHPGTGDGDSNPIGWGPLMGAPFFTNLTTWSDGSYLNSTNGEQDDLSIITQFNFDFRDDDHPGITELTFNEANRIFHWGIVERSSDADMFSFAVESGTLDINISPFRGRPNLDLRARLLDSQGLLVGSSNPEDHVDAYLNLDVDSPEQFLLIVDGVGASDLYTEYASLGLYTIDIAIKNTCTPGDVNQDGTIDLTDIAPFVDSLLVATYVCEADLNQDGVVDLTDVAPFVELLSGN